MKSGRINVQQIALALCSGVLVAGILVRFIHNRPTQAFPFAPDWLPVAAAVIAGAGVIRLNGLLLWFRLQRALLMTGLLLMVWAANGIPFDLLALGGLIGDPTTGQQAGVDWPGMVTRLLALATVVALARIALAHPASQASLSSSSWYGYAAFVLAMPYPVIRTIWAFGGMTGLSLPGAGGVGFIPWLACIPWLMAAALSLLLVSTSGWKPRRFLLVAGWTATAIVAMIGPMSVWTLVVQILSHSLRPVPGMAMWVPCLFYCSWFLWAIAGFAATRSYQLRSYVSDNVLTNVTE